MQDMQIVTPEHLLKSTEARLTVPVGPPEPLTKKWGEKAWNASLRSRSRKKGAAFAATPKEKDRVINRARSQVQKEIETSTGLSRHHAEARMSEIEGIAKELSADLTNGPALVVPLNK